MVILKYKIKIRRNLRKQKLKLVNVESHASTIEAQVRNHSPTSRNIHQELRNDCQFTRIAAARWSEPSKAEEGKQWGEQETFIRVARLAVRAEKTAVFISTESKTFRNTETPRVTPSVITAINDR